MSDEYKTLNDAPIGEIIIVSHFGKEHVFKILYKGKLSAFGEDKDGRECNCPLSVRWRYPIDPIEELENKLLQLWRGQDVAYALDEWKDIPHRWVLQVMVEAGADPAKL